MIRHYRVLALVLALFCGAPLAKITSSAVATCRHHAACVHCPRCQACCDLDVKKEDEPRHCWKVECEKICVPRVVFPWQKGGWHQRKGDHSACQCASDCSCDGGSCTGNGCANGAGTRGAHNGAWVKTVRVLKKHRFTCPTCSYSWSPRKTSCSHDGCSAD